MNLESEVLEIINAKRDDRLAGLADRFRHGSPTSQITSLLDSDNAEVVSIGAWILSEIDSALYMSEGILFRLRALTSHDDPAVRFNAFGALFPALRKGNPEDQRIIERLIEDSNKGVRIQAQAASERLMHKPD